MYCYGKMSAMRYNYPAIVNEEKKVLLHKKKDNFKEQKKKALLKNI